MANTLAAFNLQGFIEEHRDALKPPRGSHLIFQDSQFVVMVIGGPNSRRDFHVDPSDEFFYQLEGDMVLEYIDSDGERQQAPIREGEVLMCPANVPHSPQRQPDTVGLVVQRVRAKGEPEGFQWYCERCNSKIREVARDGDAELDLSKLIQEYNSSVAFRTCQSCGHVHEAATGPRV